MNRIESLYIQYTKIYQVMLKLHKYLIDEVEWFNLTYITHMTCIFQAFLSTQTG
jgi:hypothetical protein